MIDSSQEYRTRAGKRVIGLHIVTHNSCGSEVTYPVKGTIIEREAGEGTRELKRFAIWSAEGVSDVVWGNHRADDLVQGEKTCR